MEGGEIFVPLLPTMRLIDLAHAVLAVHARGHCRVLPMGLRPGGEKIHERMLSDEEPKRTLSRAGSLLITPSHRTWSTQPYRGGERLPEAYRYTSEDGTVLSPEQLVRLLKEDEVTHEDPLYCRASR